MPNSKTRSSPNFLVIQVDQMTPGVLPVHGHKLLKSPHIDALAETGVVFDNAYCNFPLCVPSRMSMMTGRLTSAIEQWDNAIELPAARPTLAHYLRSLGYHTPCSAARCTSSAPTRCTASTSASRRTSIRRTSPGRRIGSSGERYRPTGINPRAVVEAGVCVRNLQIDYDDEVEHAGLQKIYDLARFQNDKPFLLLISFTHPHSPFITTQRYWDLYDHAEIDMPAVPPIPADELDEMSRWLHYGHGQGPADHHGGPRPQRSPCLLRHVQLPRRQGRAHHGGDASVQSAGRHRPSSSPPITARCWASGACGSSSPSSSPPRGCR